jgi:nucleotide-binding universal stress UspA family protein
MGFLGRILAPVEFSERCAGAVHYAKAVADHFGAELILLHVVPPAPPSEIPEELYDRRAAETTRKLDSFMAEEVSGPAVRRIVIKGDPARKIVQYARNERADMILMPTHGFGPFRRFILGSNTAKVLHDADCPVWTGVHMEEVRLTAALPFRHILCAVDLGPQSAHVLAWAAALRSEFDARLTLAHATIAMPAMAKGADANWSVTLRGAAEEELQQLRCDSGAEAQLVVEPGEPAQVIAAAAQRLQADVVVIGRGSAGGAIGRLRANAYAIIRQSPCPVVSV